MSKAACQHRWTMTNVRSGYLVVEGCFHCRNRISFFSQEPGKKTWVYAALCANTSHSPEKCVSPKSLKALDEYFNQGIKDPDKKILVVPCSLRKSVDTCQGVVLADFGLTDLY